jgi:hypothetical protein
LFFTLTWPTKTTANTQGTVEAEVTNDSCQIKEGPCISWMQDAENESSKNINQDRMDMVKYH